MKIKLENANVLISAKDNQILEHISIITDGGYIQFVGKDNKNLVADRTIDCSGKLIMPAFVNAHAHSAMTLFRGTADDLPLEDWLHQSIFPREANLTQEDVYWGSLLAFAEYARGGIATVGDMYFFPEAVAHAAEVSGMQVTLIGGATDFGKSAHTAAKAQQDAYLAYHKKSVNIDYFLGVHAEYTCTDQLIGEMVTLSHDFHAPLYTHMSETLHEVGACTKRHQNLSPVMYFHSMGFFDRGATVAHCVHVDKDDIDLLKQSKVHVVINSCSNLKLASGIAPVFTMHNRNIDLSLGTDGAASNNALDFFREMYVTSVLAKCTMNDAAVLPTKEILHMATKGGAQALHINCGTIQVGQLANLTMLSLLEPHMQPLNGLQNNIVYAAKSSDVCMTMSCGKILYQDGNYYLGESVDEIYRQAYKRSQRLR